MKSNLRILIVRTDRMGDVVLTTPAVYALRKAYPEAHLAMLVAASTWNLVQGNPNLDQILIDDRRREHKGFWGFWKLVQSIRVQKFDCAVIFHTKKRTNAVCFFAGIPRRVGYKNNKYGFLLTDPIKDERHMGQSHEAQFCLDIVCHLLRQKGDESTLAEFEHVELNRLRKMLYVSVQDEAQQWVLNFFQQQKIKQFPHKIVIHPGASDPSKRWPAHCFAKVIVEILKKSDETYFLIVGDRDAGVIAEKIIAYVNDELSFDVSIEKFPIINVTGQTSVGQLSALFRYSSLLISNDSGPVHLAAGVGIPVICIFVRNQPGINPQRWCALGEKSCTISIPLDHSISFKKAKHIDVKYLEKITPQEVLEAVDAIFKL